MHTICKLSLFNYYCDMFCCLSTSCSESSWLFFVIHQNETSTYWFYDHNFQTESTLYNNSLGLYTAVYVEIFK
jgi:hypothetical protein